MQPSGPRLCTDLGPPVGAAEEVDGQHQVEEEPQQLVGCGPHPVRHFVLYAPAVCVFVCVCPCVCPCVCVCAHARVCVHRPR
jgi:hypothetical protein